MRENEQAAVPAPEFLMSPGSVLAEVVREYLDIFVQNALTKPAAAKAPVPENPQRRTTDVKGYSYFMGRCLSNAGQRLGWRNRTSGA
jgi:hypothetical protein